MLICRTFYGEIFGLRLLLLHWDQKKVSNFSCSITFLSELNNKLTYIYITLDSNRKYSPVIVCGVQCFSWNQLWTLVGFCGWPTHHSNNINSNFSCKTLNKIHPLPARSLMYSIRDLGKHILHLPAWNTNTTDCKLVLASNTIFMVLKITCFSRRIIL